MEEKLTAEPRAGTGKGVARKVRASGRVPAVVYGHGIPPVHVSVDAKDLYHVLHTAAGSNVLIDLAVGKDRVLAMPREIQRDHLQARFIHVDFLRIARDEKITVEVPVHLVGESHGVTEGGVVEHHLWNLELECFPQDVPSSIEADITALGIGDSLKVSDLKIPGNTTVLTSLDETIVSIVHPQILVVEEEEAEEVEGEEAAEGAEGAEEGEAPAEGGESQTETES
jgi:large subunit ribosomal protein L25